MSRSVELEQMKNDLAVKLGVLVLREKLGEIRVDNLAELVEIYNEYKREGTSETELRALYDDVTLALGER